MNHKSNKNTSDKPDDSAWMDYLYGEIDPLEKEKMEVFLKNNPQAQNSFRQFQEVRNTLSLLKNRESVSPPQVPFIRPFWKTTFFKTTWTIAAALVIIMLAARLTDMRISQNQGEFSLYFGSSSEKQKPLSKTQVQHMIDESMVHFDVTQTAPWREENKKWIQLWNQHTTQHTQQIDQLANAVRHKNQPWLQEIIRSSKQEQRQYLRTALDSYTLYLASQQNNQWSSFYNRMDDIEKNNYRFQQETGAILSGLVGLDNNPPYSSTTDLLTK